MQFEIIVFGQGITDTFRAESINPTKITETFGGNRVYYTFKKNKKCKLRFVAPRSIIYKGS